MTGSLRPLFPQRNCPPCDEQPLLRIQKEQTGTMVLVYRLERTRADHSIEDRVDQWIVDRKLSPYSGISCAQVLYIQYFEGARAVFVVDKSLLLNILRELGVFFFVWFGVNADHGRRKAEVGDRNRSRHSGKQKRQTRNRSAVLSTAESGCLRAYFIAPTRTPRRDL